MDQQQLYSKTLRYQKTGVDIFFNLFRTVQRSGQLMVEQALEQSSWLPKSSRKNCVAWLEECTRNTLAVKDMVDQGYRQMDHFGTTDTPKKTAKKAAPANPASASKDVSAGTSESEVKAKSTPVAPVKTKVSKAKPAVSSRRTATRKKAAPKKATPTKAATTKAATTKAATRKAAPTKNAAAKKTTAKTTTTKTTTPKIPNITVETTKAKPTVEPVAAAAETAKPKAEVQTPQTVAPAKPPAASEPVKTSKELVKVEPGSDES